MRRKYNSRKYAQICLRENKSTRKLILQKLISMKINLFKRNNLQEVFNTKLKWNLSNIEFF